jgi:hypothetical protein
MERLTLAVSIALITIAPAFAQNFTTAAEVKPILSATKPQWIAVREYDGKDLLYFTNLLAWRCGVETVSYGLNGAAPDVPLVIEPCYDTEAQPNALKMDQGVMPFVSHDLASIQTVTVLVTFDDGSIETGEYVRAAVMTP